MDDFLNRKKVPIISWRLNYCPMGSSQPPSCDTIPLMSEVLIISKIQSGNFVPKLFWVGEKSERWKTLQGGKLRAVNYPRGHTILEVQTVRVQGL
jgi:hypothetical protein